MMVDLSADHYVLDDLEDAVLTHELGLTAHTAYRLPDVIGEGDPSEGGYLHRDVTFHLPTKTAAGAPYGYSPKPGDVETIAGVGYTVLDVRQPKHGDFWGLTCRLASITEDAALVDSVTLHPSVDTPTAAGSKVSVHDVAHADFTNVPAKIELRASVPQEYHGMKQFVEVYDIYVASELPQLYSGDVIKDGVDGGGNVYTIVSWRNREQIDERSVIVCEFRPIKDA